MKSDRQKLILELISNENIKTQQQLLDMLTARGVRCTQATLSRDIQALNLIKHTGADGAICYGLDPSSAVESDARKFLNIARLATLSLDAASNTIVIRTMPGLARAVRTFVDMLDKKGFVGRVAGNDTILLVMKDSDAADELCAAMRELLFQEPSPKTTMEESAL